MNNNNKSKWTSFFDIIKNLFWLLLFLQFAPVILSNLRTSIADHISPKTQIGQITITGEISDSAFYVKSIHNFLKSPDIKALLIKIDSPGGAPGSAQAIFNEINKFKTQKPVVAYIENVGASAAYNIAAASSHIIANPSSLVGCIGVWFQIPPDIKDLGESWKIKFRTIQTGKYKTTGSPFKAMTAEEAAHLQWVSDDSYNEFVKEMAAARNISAEKHTEWADGKIFTGNQALQLKLIDQLGCYQDAIDKIKELALIDTEIQIVYAKRPTPMQRLFGDPEDLDDAPASFSTSVANCISEIVTKVSMNLSTQQQKLQ